MNRRGWARTRSYSRSVAWTTCVAVWASALTQERCGRALLGLPERLLDCLVGLARHRLVFGDASLAILIHPDDPTPRTPCSPAPGGQPDVTRARSFRRARRTPTATLAQHRDTTARLTSDRRVATGRRMGFPDRARWGSRSLAREMGRLGESLAVERVCRSGVVVMSRALPAEGEGGRGTSAVSGVAR